MSWPRGERLADGRVLNILERPGPVGAPLLVLIHSLGTDHRIWDDVAPRLEGAASVLSYDLAGHGLSDLGHSPLTIERHGEDLAALLAARGTPAVLCGLSIGGLVAIDCALRRPERVAGLVLSDTDSRIGTAARYAERLERVQTGGIEAIAEEQMTRWFSPRFVAVDGERVALMRNLLCRQPLDGYLANVAALRDAHYCDRVGAIAQPTLCLVGAQDASTPPARVRALAEAIPGARYSEVPEAGHLPPLEQPERFAALLSAFLQRLLARLAGDAAR